MLLFFIGWTYTGNSTYDAVLDQVESDFKEAMELLPSRDQGGEWEKGRATCGAAAGYYARALMTRHKFKDALTVLKDIIGKKYGTYELMDNYGDNFREGPAYRTTKKAFSKCNSSTWNHKEPMTSGLR